jgi:hypothetical protein
MPQEQSAMFNVTRCEHDLENDEAHDERRNNDKAQMTKTRSLRRIA